MTAQVSYSIAGLKDTGLFGPSLHGLRPVALSTSPRHTDGRSRGRSQHPPEKGAHSASSVFARLTRRPRPVPPARRRRPASGRRAHPPLGAWRERSA